MAELLKEANMLGGLRHPNIVWVYGIVLPSVSGGIDGLKARLPPGMAIDAVRIATNAVNRSVVCLELRLRCC